MSWWLGGEKFRKGGLVAWWVGGLVAWRYDTPTHQPTNPPTSQYNLPKWDSYLIAKPNKSHTTFICHSERSEESRVCRPEILHFVLNDK
ncbi:MAG: hypothetical protein ACPGWR_02915 [Ardenticatenaceae bacterium]